MSRHRAGRRPWLVVLRLLLAVVTVTAGAVALFGGPGGPPAAATVSTPAVADSPRAPVVAEAAVTTRGALPTRVQVPSIGVDSALVGLGVDAAGTLVPPEDIHLAGWFAQGPAPGEVGPAVLAGHVDSHTGPGVFFRLEEVEVGDAVLVQRGDGTTATFAVTRVTQYPKTAFPTSQVYGPTPDAQLRLITCGGAFDRSRRSYTDNIVVYARLTG